MVTSKPARKVTKPKAKPKGTGRPVGRPAAMTPAVVSKIEDAFKMGCTDTEACLYAEISHQTLYDYQNKHPEFLERKQKLKETPILKARRRVVAEVETDTKAAQWFLERKKADEFGAKQDIQVNHTHRLDDNQLLDLFSQMSRPLTITAEVQDAEFTPITHDAGGCKQDGDDE
jgi:hypothetical protein